MTVCLIITTAVKTWPSAWGFRSLLVLLGDSVVYPNHASLAHWPLRYAFVKTLLQPLDHGSLFLMVASSY